MGGFQQTILSKIKDIVNRLNEMAAKSRQIDDLPDQKTTVPTGYIHTSNNGISEKVPLDKIITKKQTLQEVINDSGDTVNVNTSKPLSYTSQNNIIFVSEKNISLNTEAGVVISNLSGKGNRTIGVDEHGKLIELSSSSGDRSEKLQDLDSVLEHGYTSKRGIKILSGIKTININGNSNEQTGGSPAQITVHSNNDGRSTRITDEYFKVTTSGDGMSTTINNGSIEIKQDKGSIKILPEYVKGDYKQTLPSKSGTFAMLEDVKGNNLVLGVTATTACRGDMGKSAYDHSQSKGNPHNTKMADIEGLQGKFEKLDKLREYITKENTSSVSFLNIGSKDNSIIKLIRNNSSVFVVNDAGMRLYTDLTIDKSIKGGTYEITFGSDSFSPLVFNRLSPSAGEHVQFQVAGSVKAGIKGNGSVYGSEATRENEFTTLSQVKTMIEKALNGKNKS